MGNLGLAELLVIFIVALLVIGPRRLPEVARAIGEAVRSFQDAMNPVRSVQRDHKEGAGSDEPGSARIGTAVPSQQIERGEGSSKRD